MLSRFRDDEVGKIFQTDNLLIKYGKELYSGPDQNPIQVMKPMRLIGNILHKYREASCNMSISVDEMLPGGGGGGHSHDEPAACACQ